MIGGVCMKIFTRICGTLSLLCYLFVLYQLSLLCQYGGVRNHLPMLVVGMLGFFAAGILWLILKKYKKKDAFAERESEFILWAGVLLFIIGSVYFGGRIVYSAIPYHGALSWKIDEWRRKKEVKLEHDNIFKDGVSGILEDLAEALTLPKQLYLTNSWQTTFDENGTIQTLSAFIYGKDDKGQKKTYLIDYDADKDEKMTVWINGEVNGNYDEEKRLEPMLTILDHADYEKEVEQWVGFYESRTYEIKYTGYSYFSTINGLQYLPGDVNGDGHDTSDNLFQLNAGGEIAGFAVSLYVSGEQMLTPVHYIMEPKYISQQVLNQEQQNQHMEQSKDTEGWTVDDTDGSMYFFLDDNKGWRLVVVDAAAGSRFYGMEATKDGGLTWEKIQLPMETVTTLPDLAEECGFTVEDYDYLTMPEYDESKKVLTITVLTEATESEGITFESQDQGETWSLK